MALMSGAEYRDSLRDGRQVWIEGERVPDVTRHPAFQPMIEAIGQIYDLHVDPRQKDTFTYSLPSGELASRFYKLPTTQEDVRNRRLFTLAVLNEVSPVMDRFGDETVTPLFVLSDRRELLNRFDKRYAENVDRWLSRLQRENLFMTSGNTDPKGDRSKQPYQQKDPDHYLHVVDERDDGIIISGAKFETGASYAHVAFVKPTVGQWLPENRDYAVACIVPMNAPGLHQICRAPLSLGRNAFERPLSSRWDEIDTMMVFDNVLVPWENVMFSRQPELANLIRQDLTRWAAQGFLLRSCVKADLLVGAACLVAEQTRLAAIPQVREKIAQLMVYAQAVKAFALASEYECERTEGGYFMPNQALQNAGRVYATSNYFQAVQILRDLGGGSTILAPDMKTLRNKEIGHYVEKYFHIDDVDAEARIRTLHLVSELTSTLFAGRTQLYQMFAESPLSAQAAALYGTYDRKSAMTRAVKLAGLTGSGGDD
jgi:4-hydroxyphenylacetate 3-monooxygenase